MMKQACDLSGIDELKSKVGRVVEEYVSSKNVDAYSSANHGQLMRLCMKETRGKANPVIVSEFITDILNEKHTNKITKNWNKHLEVSRDIRLNITPLYEYLITEFNLASSIMKKKLSSILIQHAEFITHSYLCAIYGGAFNDLHSKHHGDVIEILYAVWVNILNNKLEDMERFDDLSNYYNTLQESRGIVTTIDFDDTKGLKEVTSRRVPRTY